MIIYQEIKILIVVTMILAATQIWLSRKEHWWKGIVVPAVYLVFAVPYTSIHFLADSSIRLIPDYYQTATYLFPGILLLMIYFIFYFYHQYSKAGK